MIKLCVFDLDGTVLDTVESIAYYGNFALEKHGIEPIPVEQYKYLAGNGIINLIKNMLNFRGCMSEENFEKSFVKGIDKVLEMWYNDRVALREDLRGGQEIGH